jgi:hypothetical protein
MTGKNILLTVVIVLLGGLCFFLYKDRFASPPIQISHRSVQPRGAMLRAARDSTADTVIFLLNREVRLSSVKVIPVTAVESSKDPHPVWSLSADSRSAPVKDFIYGETIQGMKPAVKGAVAAPLQPGTPYRLLITAGSSKAQHEFTPSLRSP